VKRYGATKVVTLEAGMVAVNVLLPTAMLDCCARSRLDDVTHGVTEATVGKPLKV
jgi:hypothetical protein